MRRTAGSDAYGGLENFLLGFDLDALQRTGAAW